MQKEVFPIIAYGHPVLRLKAALVKKETPHLEALIEKMYQTMYNANGVGLAAPQIGKSLRIFTIDANPFADKDEANNNDLRDFKGAFINPNIIEEEGEEWGFEEGCLSIPGLHEKVYRKPSIKVSYRDENFNLHEKKLTGIAARIFQHEYDHLEGVLFLDKLTPFKRTLIQNKLKKIRLGKIDAGYKMKFTK